MTQTYLLERALLNDGWASSVQLEVDAQGNISELISGVATPASGTQYLAGVTLPGMPNLHSHAFQRGLAGLAEAYSGSGDNFWSWRQQMYQLVARLDPPKLQAIAEQLYLEMLKAGYTAVAEFHYLHHDADGKPYADIATMSHAILQAATTTGIALTHLPVLYMSPGFEGGTLGPAQACFGFSRVGDFLQLVSQLQVATHDNPQVNIGIAPHSLRAVPIPALQQVCADFSELAPAGPIHIHIAEQLREIEDCLAHTGRRPLELLCEQLPVDERWCLVHATHMNVDEMARLSGTAAMVGLCPTTEANLGDGLFPLAGWREAGGGLGIGSDSNTSVSPLEELRWLEYGQRLRQQQRNIFADEDNPHVGLNLWLESCRGGARALGRAAHGLAIGARADLVTVDPEHPVLLGRNDNVLVDSLVFSGNSNTITQVVSGGQWLIREGRHAREEEIRNRFKQAIRDLQ